MHVTLGFVEGVRSEQHTHSFCCYPLVIPASQNQAKTGNHESTAATSRNFGNPLPRWLIC